MIVVIVCVGVGIIVFVIVYCTMDKGKDEPNDEEIEALDSDQVLFNWDDHINYFLAKQSRQSPTNSVLNFHIDHNRIQN